MAPRVSPPMDNNWYTGVALRGVGRLPPEKLAGEPESRHPVRCEQFVPAHTAHGGKPARLSFRGQQPLQEPDRRPWGSATTEKRLTLGISVGGTSTVPPSRSIQSALAPMLSVPIYSIQLGLTPILQASAERSISPLTETPPTVNRTYGAPGRDWSLVCQPTTLE